MKSKRDANAIFVERFDLGGDGPTVAIKDTIDVAGHPTRAASRALEHVAPAKRNAGVVAALLAAGCRIVGKANLHELAYGVTGINEWTGTPLNTRFPDRVPGGSSSGSAAAVAAGLADFAIGTDTGGSIRVPAACCGVAGLKPTFGRVSRAGVMPERSSLDCVGPFAADVAGIERVMAMIDPAFLALGDVAGFRIGAVETESEPAIGQAVAAALRACGAPHETVRLPGMAASFDAGITIIGAETYAALEAYAASPELGADVRDRLAAARTITPEALVAAEMVRASFIVEVDALFDRFDILALPAMPVPPLTLAMGRDARAAIRMTAFVRPFNLSGHPAIVIPLAPAGGYAPALQLVARRGEDPLLCAVARAIEAAA